MAGVKGVAAKHDALRKQLVCFRQVATKSGDGAGAAEATLRKKISLDLQGFEAVLRLNPMSAVDERRHNDSRDALDLINLVPLF